MTAAVTYVIEFDANGVPQEPILLDSRAEGEPPAVESEAEAQQA